MIIVPSDVMDDLKAGRAKVRFWWRVDTSPVTAIWTGKTSLTYNAIVYLPCPVASPPKFAAQGSDLGVRTTTVELPAPSNLVDEFFDSLDLGLDQVRSGFWIVDDAGTVRLNRQLHRGRVDNLEAGDATSDISILKLTSTTRAADTKRIGGRIACDSDQRRRDPLDGFLRHTAGAQDIEIIVGGLGPVSQSGSVSVTGGGRDFGNFDQQYR
jgi:hypothetical protein